MCCSAPTVLNTQAVNEKDGYKRDRGAQRSAEANKRFAEIVSSPDHFPNPAVSMACSRLALAQRTRASRQLHGPQHADYSRVLATNAEILHFPHAPASPRGRRRYMRARAIPSHTDENAEAARIEQTQTAPQPQFSHFTRTSQVWPLRR
jgi:hypothetical protein